MVPRDPELARDWPRGPSEVNQARCRLRTLGAVLSPGTHNHLLQRLSKPGQTQLAFRHHPKVAADLTDSTGRLGPQQVAIAFYGI